MKMLVFAVPENKPNAQQGKNGGSNDACKILYVPA
jgi:hypothetical protein